MPAPQLLHLGGAQARAAFLEAYRSQRTVFFARVIWALVIFIVVVATIQVRLRAADANSISTAVSAALSSAGAVRSLPLADLPAAVSQLARLGNMSYVVPEGGGAVPTVGMHNVLLGGVRLSQSRFATAPCPDASVYARLAPVNSTVCLSTDLSSADYGIALNESYVNSSLVRAFQYRPNEAARFSGALGSSVDLSQPFFVVFPTIADAAAGTTALLTQHNWFDSASSTVSMYFLLLNSALGAWTEVLITYSTSLGGAIIGNTQTQTLWTAAPTRGANILDGVFITLVAFQLFELLLQPLLHLWSACFRALESRRPACALLQRPTLKAAGAYTVHLLTALLMLAAAIGIKHQDTLVVEAQALISLSKWSPRSFEADAIGLQDAVAHVARSQAVLEVLAIACAVLASLKVLVSTSSSFGNRLSNLHRAFARAVPDLLAVGVLVVIVFATFGITGQVIYSAAVSDWSTPMSAGFAIFKNLNGEGPTAQMTAAAPTATAIFYGSSYILLQSCLVVLFFAVIGDSFSSVREETAAELARIWEAADAVAAAEASGEPSERPRLLSQRLSARLLHAEASGLLALPSPSRGSDAGSGALGMSGGITSAPGLRKVRSGITGTATYASSSASASASPLKEPIIVGSHVTGSPGQVFADTAGVSLTSYRPL